MVVAGMVVVAIAAFVVAVWYLRHCRAADRRQAQWAQVARREERGSVREWSGRTQIQSGAVDEDEQRIA